MHAHIDFETRSPVLITRGLDLYLAQAEILCMGWAIGDDEPSIWTPGEPFPRRLLEHIRNGHVCIAHNAEFEHGVFTRLLPEYAPHDYQWWCTAVQAAACGLPRSLAGAARAAGITQQKSARGMFLIQQLCIPPYVERPEWYEELAEYCLQDVRTERALYHVMRKPSAEESRDFLTNLRINARGLPIDAAMARGGARMAADNRAHAERLLEKATGGALTKLAGVQVVRWVSKEIGTELDALDKYVRQDLLDRDDLPAHVRTALEIIDDYAYSSVGKYRAALARLSPDGRLRGSYMLNGAGQTGRFSSTGLQVHNLPRLPMDDVLAAAGLSEGHEDQAVETLCSDITDGRSVAQETLSYMLRPLIRASEGNWLVWGDWSSIEGRILPWLADTDASREKLALYAAGEDIYVHTAREMFHVEHVTASQRQEGKVAELALGYSGGPGALHSMARNYGLKFDDGRAREVVAQWRGANPWAVEYWNDVERAFHEAYANPGEVIPAGRVRYLHTPEMQSVWCLLPSGRVICYRDVRYTTIPAARRRPGDDPKAVQLTALRGEAGRVSLWRGLLVENITQAVAADVLRTHLRRHRYWHEYTVGHTHDEIILEVPSALVDEIKGHLQRSMEEAPVWAKGLPLHAKIEEGVRYAK